jgi:hypothetical protein
MLKKTILQFLLLFGIVLASIIFYNIYFNKENVNIDAIKTLDLEKSLSEGEKGNLIYNIEYRSSDKNEYNYIIKSKLGVQSDTNPNVIFMKKVIATINLKDKTPINISSKSALFNNITFDTEFNGEVIVIYDEHTINSEKLDLLFKKNLAFISDEIFYKNLNTQLQADKIEINLLTKHMKVFMNDKSKKIKILNIN